MAARIAIVIALLLSVVSAYFGWQAKTGAEAKNDVLKQTKSTLASTQADLTKTKGELKNTQAELASSQEDVKKKTAEIGNLTNEKAELAGKLDTATKDLEAKTQALSTAEKTIADLKIVIGEVPPEELKANIEKLKSDLAKAQTELAEAKQIQETQKSRIAELDSKLNNTEKVVTSYKKEVSLKGATGRIVAYNPGWNFVVLNLGDKQGIRANAPMVIMRDGEMIGRLKVSSVEPSTSIGDVVPGSVAKGINIEPGDAVVVQ